MDTPQHSEILTVLHRIDVEARSFRAEVLARFGAVETAATSFRGEVLARFGAVETAAASFRGEVVARFDDVDRRLGGVNGRLDRIDLKIDGLRDELVDLIERVHQELDLRLRDIEPRSPRARAK